MRRNKFCLVIWLAAAVLLFFCFFGRTDAQGFHSGWLFAARPGWLWLSILAYLAMVTAGLITALLLGRPRKATTPNQTPEGRPLP